MRVVIDKNNEQFGFLEDMMAFAVEDGHNNSTPPVDKN